MTAKVFQSGNSQAVRIPKEFRFKNQDELFIKKIGDSILLTPKNSVNP
jgi:antitoxin VapB